MPAVPRILLRRALADGAASNLAFPTVYFGRRGSLAACAWGRRCRGRRVSLAGCEELVCGSGRRDARTWAGYGRWRHQGHFDQDLGL